MIPDIEQRRTELEVLCRRLGARRLELFDSAATDAFRPACDASDAAGRQAASDLDFLVESESPARPGYVDRYFGLLEALEALLRSSGGTGMKSVACAGDYVVLTNSRVSC